MLTFLLLLDGEISLFLALLLFRISFSFTSKPLLYTFFGFILVSKEVYSVSHKANLSQEEKDTIIEDIKNSHASLVNGYKALSGVQPSKEAQVDIEVGTDNKVKSVELYEHESEYTWPLDPSLISGNNPEEASVVDSNPPKVEFEESSLPSTEEEKPLGDQPQVPPIDELQSSGAEQETQSSDVGLISSFIYILTTPLSLALSAITSVISWVFGSDEEEPGFTNNDHSSALPEPSAEDVRYDSMSNDSHTG